MTNKKRIRKLIERKYKPGKIYPKFPWHFSDAKDAFISNFGINADLLGRAAEKASKSFLNFYNSITKALLYPEQSMFNMLPLSGADDQRELYNWHLESGRYSGKSENLVDYILQKNIEEISKKHSDHLTQYIRRNLEDFGIFFETENEFLNFAKDRITRISFSDSMYHFEYYLDYTSETDKGILIGISNGKIEWKYEPNRITVTIG